ncbi:hypothetical protein GGP93_003158 [Salinibacter ruber]|nr:hypothetical protein [Salinibacter ruber]
MQAVMQHAVLAAARETFVEGLYGRIVLRSA